MQFKDAQILKKEWGNKPCSHPEITKEYVLGTSTGDYVCTTCGTTYPNRNDFKKDNKKE